VLRAFVGDDALPAETIHVTASDGTVTLNGSVELPYQRDEQKRSPGTFQRRDAERNRALRGRS
jgi:hypothetical protein